MAVWRGIITASLWLLLPPVLAYVLSRHPPVIGHIPMDRRELFMALWVVFGVALTLTLGLVDLAIAGLRLLGVLHWGPLLRPLGLRLTILGLAGLLTTCLVYARVVEPYWLTTTTIRLPVPGLHRPVRLVQISDVHDDHRFPLETRIVQRVNALSPDIIVFSGDTINQSGRLDAFRGMLSQLSARHAKLAVRGNWDVWYWTHDELFKGTGFVELAAGWQAVDIDGDRLFIGGHAYLDEARWSQLVGQVPTAPGLKVFIYHSPDYPTEAAASGIDLYLSGHTHGGQVRLPWYGALVTLARYGKRYERGLYRIKDLTMYVNSGLGVEPAIPLRFLTRPEVTLFILEPPGNP